MPARQLQRTPDGVGVQHCFVADGLSNSVHQELSTSYQETRAVSLLSMLTFHSWYPRIFSPSLGGQGWELRCPFQTKHVFSILSLLSLFLSLSRSPPHTCEGWLYWIYLMKFCLFSNGMCSLTLGDCWALGRHRAFSTCLITCWPWKCCVHTHILFRHCHESDFCAIFCFFTFTSLITCVIRFKAITEIGAQTSLVDSLIISDVILSWQ